MNIYKHLKYVFILGIVTVIVTCLWELRIFGHIFGSGGTPFLFVDPDDFIMLTRIRDFFNFGSVSYSLLNRVNIPNGAELYWTHLYDALLIGFTWIISLFVDSLDRSIEIAGFIIAPIFRFFNALVLAGILKKVSPKIAYVTALIFLLDTKQNEIFCFGRPDHHAFIMFTELCFLYRLERFIYAQSCRRSILLALATAICLWASIETLPMVLISESMMFFIMPELSPKTMFRKSLITAAFISIILIKLNFIRCLSVFLIISICASFVKWNFIKQYFDSLFDPIREIFAKLDFVERVYALLSNAPNDASTKSEFIKRLSDLLPETINKIPTKTEFIKSLHFPSIDFSLLDKKIPTFPKHYIYIPFILLILCLNLEKRQIYDELSGTHINLYLAAALYYYIFAISDFSSIKAKFGFGAIIGAVFLYFYPNFLLGIEGNTSEFLRKFWFPTIQDLAPIFRVESISFPTVWSIESIMLGIIWYDKIVIKTEEENANDKFWTILSTLAICYAIFTVMACRMIFTMQMLTFPVIMQFLYSKLSTKKLRLISISIIAVINSSQLFLEMKGGFLNTRLIRVDQERKLSEIEFFKSLNKISDKPVTIMSDPYHATQILYYSKQNVVVVPYHRQEKGIISSLIITQWPSYDEALTVNELLKTNSSYVLVRKSNAGPTNLEGFLSRGAIPDWITIEAEDKAKQLQLAKIHIPLMRKLAQKYE